MREGIVAIVGRPNVGKSTLFNQLTRTRKSIVDDRPGVTRDRLYGRVVLDSESERSCTVIDTGGFEKDDYKFQPFADNLVWQQTEHAIDEADIVLFVVDAKDGVHPHDKEISNILRRKNKKVVAICNKVDGIEHTSLGMQFFEIGLDVVPVSAAHRRGFSELFEALEVALDEVGLHHTQSAVQEGQIRLALVGRPNVGKSSILNRLCGTDRSLVSDVAGTTRDAIDACIKHNHRTYSVIDTAGIRRKAKVTDSLENLCVLRSLRVIDEADVVFLVIDAVGGLTDQDARLMDYATSRYKPTVIVVNKWDLAEEKDSNLAEAWRKEIHRRLQGASYIPVAFVSCLENQRIHQLLALASQMMDFYARRVPTSAVNELMEKMVREHTPALMNMSNRRIKFYYATQAAQCPPTFVVFCNVSEEIQESYKRYMTNRIRDELGFDQIPVKLVFRAKGQREFNSVMST
jgi:GTPase